MIFNISTTYLLNKIATFTCEIVWDSSCHSCHNTLAYECIFLFLMADSLMKKWIACIVFCRAHNFKNTRLFFSRKGKFGKWHGNLSDTNSTENLGAIMMERVENVFFDLPKRERHSRQRLTWVIREYLEEFKDEQLRLKNSFDRIKLCSILGSLLVRNQLNILIWLSAGN